jgi:catechol 2,3-dioxygenase-like lactoylglutathione lyase family enzyme
VPAITDIDHIAITVNDLDATCTFYRRLFDARVLIEYESDGRIALRQIGLGTAVLSIHQAGNGMTLVAARPTIGAADICLRWDGTVNDALTLLANPGHRRRRGAGFSLHRRWNRESIRVFPRPRRQSGRTDEHQSIVVSDLSVTPRRGQVLQPCAPTRVGIIGAKGAEAAELLRPRVSEYPISTACFGGSRESVSHRNKQLLMR